MDANLLNGLSGLLGAILGAAVSGWFSWQIFRKQLEASDTQRKLDNAASDAQRRLDNTFAFHREFDGPSLNTSRTLAARLLEENPDLSLDQISEKMDGPETVHIWVVLSFYKRLTVSLKHGQLDPRFVSELFGAIFTWWWLICFNKKLPSFWVDDGILREFWDWLENNTDAAEMDRWVKRAELDMPRYLGTSKIESSVSRQDDELSLPTLAMKLAVDRESVSSPLGRTDPPVSTRENAS